jgi:hypothetical protein
MKRSAGLKIAVILALAQAALLIVRAAQWSQIGSQLVGQGVVLVPIVGFLALGRGAAAAIIAVLYGLFVWGALSGRGWAWAAGLIAAVANALAVVALLIAGEVAGQVLALGVVPVVLIVYLLSPAARGAGAPAA